MLPQHLAAHFPKLAGDDAIKKSDSTRQYNCLAWSAARDQQRWWQPIKIDPWDYWPDDVPDDGTFESFVILMYATNYPPVYGVAN